MCKLFSPKEIEWLKVFAGNAKNDASGNADDELI